VSNGAVASIAISSAPPSGTILVSAVVVSFASSSGQISVNPNVVYSGSSCTVFGSPQPTYTSSSLSVVIPVSSTCSGALSAGFLSF
jgi:hypothetical protein